MSKTTFRINYRPDGKWQGKQDGDERLLVISHTLALVKEDVFKRARDLGDSRVLVFNGAGDETEERTFGAARAKGHAGTWE